MAVVESTRGAQLRAMQTLPLKFKFSRQFAIDVMRRNNINIRHATGDRTVTAAEVVRAGPVFFEELNKAAAGITDPRRIINMDEFFVTLHSNGQKWTWTKIRRGERGNVQIRTSKLGFTCSVTTNAAGEILFVQVIWKGKTATVHAAGAVFSPRILQQHRADSHFQNATTFKEYCVELAERLENPLEELNVATRKPCAIAQAIRTSDAEKVVLILDRATQHGNHANGNGYLSGAYGYIYYLTALPNGDYEVMPWLKYGDLGIVKDLKFIDGQLWVAAVGGGGWREEEQ